MRIHSYNTSMINIEIDQISAKYYPVLIIYYLYFKAFFIEMSTSLMMNNVQIKNT